MEKTESLGLLNSLFGDMVESSDTVDANTMVEGEIIDIDPNKLVIPEKTHKKRSNKGTKTKSNKLSTIPDITGSYDLSKFNMDIITTTDVLAIHLLDTKLNFSLSWNELLFTLIGTIIHKSDNVIETLVNAGISNDGVKVIYRLPEYGLSEYEQYAVYKFPDTPYFLEIDKTNNSAILKSINAALAYFEFTHKDVTVDLVNKAMMAELENNEAEYNKLESKTKSLYELCKKNSTIPMRIESVEYLGMPMAVRTLNDAMLLLVTYFTNTNDKDVAIEALKKATIKDSCGVTDEEFKYLGFLDTVKISSVDLWLFQNGFVSDSLKFLNNLCKQLDIDTKTIKFNYKL